MIDLEEKLNSKHPYAGKLVVKGKEICFFYLRQPEKSKQIILDRMSDEANRKRREFVKDNGYEPVAINVVSDGRGRISMKLVCYYG